METKHILILANSIRRGKKCIAGKELIPKKGGGYTIGPWIRMAHPNDPDGAVPEQSTDCPRHGFARVLDIVKITFRGRCNDPDHPEDWWFDPFRKWEFVVHGGPSWLRHVVDKPVSLWHDGEDASVQHGYVRRMGADAATLYLIKAPAEWSFIYWKEMKNAEIVGRFRLALMCAEKDPLECHRTILVCRELRNEFEIRHILDDGQLENHSDAESRLLAEERVPTEDFFISREELIARAYDRRGARIAFHESGEPADFSGVGK